MSSVAAMFFVGGTLREAMRSQVYRDLGKQVIRDMLRQCNGSIPTTADELEVTPRWLRKQLRAYPELEKDIPRIKRGRPIGRKTSKNKVPV